MELESILFKVQEDNGLSQYNDIFTDLSIEKIINEINGNIHDSKFIELLHKPLNNINNIKYRQEIFNDLFNTSIFQAITNFYEQFSTILYKLGKLDDLYHLERERWFLDSVKMYCDSINSFLKEIGKQNIESEGLKNFVNYVKLYTGSDKFISLMDSVQDLSKVMNSIRYEITVKGVKITVKKYKESANYGENVIKLFSKFLEDEQLQYKRLNNNGFGHVEAAIVSMVAKLYPEPFDSLREFFRVNQNFMDLKIKSFILEINFYLKYLKFIKPLEDIGLSFCIPEIIDQKDGIHSIDFFDLALADRLYKNKKIPVVNSFWFNKESPVIIITGPNNGGKTTFARAIGQLHYLFLLGLPVPGKEARLFKIDKIFSHFSKSENVENSMGRLEEELVRFHNILESASSGSLIIINEMLSATTLRDGIEIGKHIIKKIQEKDAICIYTTFIYELSQLPGTMSYVAEVDIKNPEIRTHKIVKKASNGMAYAIALAEKYELTYEILKGRIS